MGHTRLEFLPLLLCPCSQKSFFQGWWWCLQLSTGSWASPNISLDDYSNLEMCTFGRSSSFVCLFFVLFLSYHKASFHYFSRFQILAFKGYLEVSGRCLECVWGPQTGVVYCLGGGANQYMSLIEWWEVYGNLLSEDKVFCTVNLV